MEETGCEVLLLPRLGGTGIQLVDWVSGVVWPHGLKRRFRSNTVIRQDVRQSYDAF